ncbi:MAG TPA: hypothetical protein VFT31_17795 [Kribbella sp.]|nr:hypothetical protein [Kribbella sp.]
MSDFQEQATNFLRNVAKRNPDKAKAEDEASAPSGGPEDTTADGTGEARADQSPTEPGDESVGDRGDGAPDAATQSGTSSADSPDPSGSTGSADSSESDEAGDADAGDGGVVGGTLPDVESQPSRSAGSGTEGTAPGSTATGQ